MTLVRWQPYHRQNPWAGFTRMQKHMNRVFDSYFDNVDDSLITSWKPRVEVKEFPEQFVLAAELPGIEKKDIKIEIQNDVLSISGERQSDIEQEKQSYHIRERSYGKFKRSFELPTQVVADKIEAEFSNGVLSLSIPKAEEAKPKQIEVKVN